MDGARGDTVRASDTREGQSEWPPTGQTDGEAGRVVMPRVVLSIDARTPEELETLFEDALVLRDDAAVAALFEEGAVLLAGGAQPVRGGEAIAELTLATWTGDITYFADPQLVMQARDLALIVAAGGTSVARRSGSGAWKYAIALLAVDTGTEGEDQ